MSSEHSKKYFTEVYNRENDALFRFCLLRVSDREKAIDLVQESFTRLWVSVSTGKSVENPRAFLFVVARNLIIDWYRKIKSFSLESLSEEGEFGVKFEAMDENAHGNIETNSDAKRALAMMNHLDPQHKEVIYLRFVEGLPPKDIAEILKLNANTVSVRITRGMEVLRGLMSGGEEKNH